MYTLFVLTTLPSAPLPRTVFENTGHNGDQQLKVQGFSHRNWGCKGFWGFLGLENIETPSNFHGSPTFSR